MRQLRIIFLFLLLLSSVRILAAGSDSLRRQEADELYRLIRYYYSKIRIVCAISYKKRSLCFGGRAY